MIDIVILFVVIVAVHAVNSEVIRYRFRKRNGWFA